MKIILTNKVKAVKSRMGYTYENLVKLYQMCYGEKITHAQLSNILKRDGEKVSIDVIEKLLWSMNISVGVVFEDVTSGYPDSVIFSKINL